MRFTVREPIDIGKDCRGWGCFLTVSPPISAIVRGRPAAVLPDWGRLRTMNLGLFDNPNDQLDAASWACYEYKAPIYIIIRVRGLLHIASVNIYSWLNLYQYKPLEKRSTIFTFLLAFGIPSPQFTESIASACEGSNCTGAHSAGSRTTQPRGQGRCHHRRAAARPRCGTRRRTP